MAGKQAKILSDKQIKAILAYLDSTKRNKERNKVIFLLSLHGLRAKEIANLELSMITDAEGTLIPFINLEDKATKNRSGRTISMNDTLFKSISVYLKNRKKHSSKYLIVTERSSKFSANAISHWFKNLYADLEFTGCSSHSGRRTFITKCARNISRVNGSLRDVQLLAGHKHLSTTQLYIDQNAEAQKQLVKTIYTI